MGLELARGVSLLDIAGSFFIQPETRATYPDLSDVGNFVNAVYNNVLGRSSDQLGFDYWVGELENNPNITQAGFILAIINGAKSETGKISQVPPLQTIRLSLRMQAKSFGWSTASLTGLVLKAR